MPPMRKPPLILLRKYWDNMNRHRLFLFCRLLLAAAGSAAGCFLSIRFRAFCSQVWSVDPPGAVSAAVILLSALAGFIAAPYGPVLFKTDRSRPAVFSFFLSFILSAILFLLQRNLHFNEALQDSPVSLKLPVSIVYSLGGILLLSLFLYAAAAGLCRLFSSRASGRRRITFRDILVPVILAISLPLAAFLYARFSHIIYFWDNAGYWSTAQSMADLLTEEGWGALFQDISRSITSSDYNHVIALPAGVFAALFGGSRGVFLACIALFGCAFTAILIWLLIRSRSNRPVICTLITLFSLPALFYLCLTGFVDVIGCVPALLAILLWLTSREKHDFFRFFLIGLCLAAVILLRRWFAFFALSFVLALLLENLAVRRSLIPSLAALMSCGFSLLFFFPTFVSGRLMQNYAASYAGYDFGIVPSLLLLFRYYGVIPVLAAGIAAFLLLRHSETSHEGLFLIAQPVICFILFSRVQTLGQQHLLLFAPAFLCLSALLSIRVLDALSRQASAVPLRHRITSWVILLILTIPSLSPLLPREQPGSLSEISRPALFPSFSWQPPRDDDADTILDISDQLTSLGEEGYRIGILASSLALNESRILNAEASLNHTKPAAESRSWLSRLPAVDARDGWNDTLFECDILLTADPVQVHLAEENQQLIVLPTRSLLLGSGFGSAWQRTSDRWTLSDGTNVMLYKRIRPVTEAEKSALRSAFYAAHPELMS